MAFGHATAPAVIAGGPVHPYVRGARFGSAVAALSVVVESVGVLLFGEEIRHLDGFSG